MSSKDDNLLAALGKATESISKEKQVASAGEKATQEVIQKAKSKANIAYNIRLSEEDSEIIEDLIFDVRKKFRKRLSSADIVRIALRTMSEATKKDPLKFL